MEDWLAQLLPFLQGNDIFTPETFALFWEGLVNTAHLVALSAVLGIVLAVPLAVGRASRWRGLSGAIWAYTYVFRGTPLLIQLYIAYYGFAFIPGVQDSPLDFFVNNPIYPALLSFTLNTAAYTCEIFYGAIRATPRGEVEAAHAYGMSAWLTYTRVILPGAFRRVLPVYTNELIFLLHASAIVSVVTITDLTGAAYTIYARFYSPFPPFLFVAVLYMALSFGIQGVFRRLERQLNQHLRPASAGAA